MTSKEIVIEVMNRTGTSKNDLAKQFGMTSAAIWSRLDVRKTSNLTANNMEEMLNAMGYRIAVIPMSEAIRPGWLTMTDGEMSPDGEEPTESTNPEELDALVRKIVREELRNQ